MRPSLFRGVALAAALAGFVGGCNTESRNIPDLTMAAASKLPPDKLPRIFRDPSDPFGYPYNIHEIAGLSRNPDDCARWGCVGGVTGGF